MRRKKNYAMVKIAVPRRMTLLNGRTFLVRYKRIKRSELRPNIVMRRNYTKRAAPWGRRGDEEGYSKDSVFLIL